MTFWLAGRCERTGAVGAVIASASMAVAARCVAVRAGTGAVCSQSTTDPGCARRCCRRWPTARRRLTRSRPWSAARRTWRTGSWRWSTPTAARRPTRARWPWVRRPTCAGRGPPRRETCWPTGVSPRRCSRPLPAGPATAWATGSSRPCRPAGRGRGGLPGAVGRDGHRRGRTVAGHRPAGRLARQPGRTLAGLWQLWQPQAQAYIGRALRPETGVLAVAPLPDPALVVLVGPSGSGKSVWAAEHYRPHEVVSSDRLRAVVGSGEHDLDASADAFALLDQIVAARLRRGLTAVVDTLGLNRRGAAATWRWPAAAACPPSRCSSNRSGQCRRVTAAAIRRCPRRYWRASYGGCGRPPRRSTARDGTW